MTNPIDRLRANLRALGIPATDADLAGIEARGFLKRLADFERIVAGVPADTLPDYLDAGSLPVPDEAAAPLPAAATAPAPLPAATLLGGAAAIRAGDATPTALVEAALARIAALDGPLNVFQLVMAEQALADARRAEAELAAGQDRGLLHGLPVAVKDLLDVAGLPTTAGSTILAHSVAASDATAVSRLRAAGAIFVGKTRLSEFAYSPGSNNAHYGDTANPFDPLRDSGGSSSGSAVAVATGMALAALGTDTGCSIRIPAAFCGLVGLKPTWGRTSLAGAVPLSWSLDHLGPLTRSVADAAALLAILAGPDPRDGRTLRHAPPFAYEELAAEARGLRVGLVGEDGSGKPLAEEEQLAAARRGAEMLATAGAEVVELNVPELDRLRVLGTAILGIEASAFHLPWLQTRLDAYGEFPRQRLLANFAYTPGDLIRAQQGRAVLRRAIGERLAGLDLLVLPIHPGPIPARGVPASHGLAIPFNCLGWPALSMPAGRGSDGLPLAVQLVARPWQEATLLRAAMVVEQALAASA
ncbi:MAG: amidase [Chloroflexaceae bacterium]